MAVLPSPQTQPRVATQEAPAESAVQVVHGSEGTAQVGAATPELATNEAAANRLGASVPVLPLRPHNRDRVRRPEQAVPRAQTEHR